MQGNLLFNISTSKFSIVIPGKVGLVIREGNRVATAFDLPNLIYSCRVIAKDGFPMSNSYMKIQG